MKISNAGSAYLLTIAAYETQTRESPEHKFDPDGQPETLTSTFC